MNYLTGQLPQTLIQLKYAKSWFQVGSPVDPSVTETNAPDAAKARKQKKAGKQKKSTVLTIQPKTYREIKREEHGVQGQGQGRRRQGGQRHQQQRIKE